MEKTKNKSTGKKVLKIVLRVLIILILVVLLYVVYLFADYYRVDDNLGLNVENNQVEEIDADTEYKLLSFNIGFGAYEPDYSFFMDGGKYSRAFSKERLNANIENIESFLLDQDSDICLLQEVDENGTRTYHVNERKSIADKMTAYGNVWAQNWDCPYLLYPITSPHGKNVAGIMTFSKFDIDSAHRVSLPIEKGYMKIVDLDRCYSVSRMPVSNGKELVIYNAHLSAYTSDGKIAEEQIKLLSSDMTAERKKGNYVICGGDFNKDLLGNAGEIFGVSGDEYTWAQPFPESLLEGTALDLIVPYEKENPIPSCRNADAPYHDGQFVLTVDGFLISDNVDMVSSNVIDTGFKYSDHNPVYMNFKLLGE